MSQFTPREAKDRRERDLEPSRSHLVRPQNPEVGRGFSFRVRSENPRHGCPEIGLLHEITLAWKRSLDFTRHAGSPPGRSRRRMGRAAHVASDSSWTGRCREKLTRSQPMVFAESNELRRSRVLAWRMSVTHPAANISSDIVSISIITDASIEVLPFTGYWVLRASCSASFGLANRRLLAPSVSPAKNVVLTLHVFLPEGRWGPGRSRD